MLCEVAEIEAQMFSFAQKFNRRTAVDLTLNSPFCQTAVVRLPFCLFNYLKRICRLSLKYNCPFSS